MRVRRVLAAIIVALCVGVPIAEAFDSWDNTLQDGNDTEANLVVAAICVGFALTVAATLIARLRARPSDGRMCVSLSSAARRTAVPAASPTPTTSPPTPLRI